MKNILWKLTRPTSFPNFIQDVLIALPRILGGLLLTIDFGGSKFGMPWTDAEAGLHLFQVAAWFPEDVASFGAPFSWAPWFFAWMGAASEAIGGLFLVLGFQTRLSGFFLACTMLVAIFFQKWGGGTWGMLPAMSFLWIAIYAMVLGSGKLGLDYWILKLKRADFAKALPFAVVAGILALSSCSSNRAGIYIAAGEQFVLGENNTGSYTLKLRNASDTIVGIRAVDKEDESFSQGFGIGPRSRAELKIRGSEKVYLINHSTKEVKVVVELSKQVQGMRYEPMSVTKDDED